MHPFWEKIEHYNRKLITPALILLLGIIIYELFFHAENQALELAVEITDALVIAVFAIDLVFLAIRSRSAKFFFKNYWLDVLAVFPFVLFFNFINSLYRAIVVTEQLAVGQALLHETVEVGREAKGLSKGGKIARFLRIAARILRVVTKSRLFAKIHHRRTKKRR
ncbi:MAG: ion transporter [Nanoarchaeota archaeon]